MVHEPHEVLRRTETGGGGKIPRALIAPGIVQRVLRHRQQLHGIVAHVGDIGRQLPGHVPVIKKVTVFMPAPRAEMHLVNVQRPVVHRLLGAAEGIVRPVEVLNVIELAGGAGAGLRVEAVGVGLVAHSPVSAGHGVFIGGIDRQIRDKALPELPLGGKGVGPRVPAVEVPHHGNGPGVGSPDVEPPAVDAALRSGMGAEQLPAIRQAAAVV